MKTSLYEAAKCLFHVVRNPFTHYVEIRRRRHYFQHTMRNLTSKKSVGNSMWYYVYKVYIFLMLL